MTHQQEFMLVLVLLPVCLVVGAVAGHLAALYGKVAEIIAGEHRPARVRGRDYWLVTDIEYDRLKTFRLLDRSEARTR